MKIVVADGLAPEGLERLRASFDVVVESGLSDDALPVALADAVAVIVRSRTRITAAAIVRARRLRVIARAGGGTDNIGGGAATHRGMRVIACDPYTPADRAARLGVELLPMEAVLERADVLTLHLPLTPRTRHIIGPAQFARMRPGIRIVNCARGGLIDEGALLAELE